MFQGKITSIPVIDGDRLSFRFKTIDSENLQLFYYIKSEHEQMELKKLSYGMTCFVNGELRRPSPATNFYAFDYHQYLYSKKTHWLLTPKDFSIQQCTNKNLTLFDHLQQFRHKGLTYIETYFPDELVGIVSALVFGERNEIDHDLLSAYQALGVVHLLAVSGLHVGLVVTTLYFLLLRIGMTRERTLLLLIIFLPFYMIIAGAAPPVIRASGMTIVVLLALYFRKRIHPLDGISFVFLVLLLLNPYYIFQLGFQLSFVVSFSLIISARVIIQKYSNYFIQLTAVTLISQLVSFPIILFHFYEISLWSLPLNLLYIPFISLVVLPSSFLTLFVHIAFPAFGDLLIYILNQSVNIAHVFLTTLHSYKYGQLLFGKPPLSIIILLYIAIVYGFMSWEDNISLKGTLKPVMIFLLICVFQWNLPYLTSNGEVTFIDVGQGDSIFIELPYRKEVYLIDTGGIVNFRKEEQWQKRRKHFEVGQDIVLPYLKAKGVRKIHRVILTHGHYDHIGGTNAVIENVKVDHLLYSYRDEIRDFEKELLAKAKAANINVWFVHEGEHWKVEDHLFYILSPAGFEQTINDGSIVLWAKIGGLYWLFTGDLEEMGEQRLVRKYPNIVVDVLKVGHHGSRTSSTPVFINHINPSVAVISAGRNNRFGHPHKEVIDHLEEEEIKVLRTDQNGAIKYSFRGSKGKFEWVLRSVK